MFAAVTLSVATDPIPLDYATLPDVVARLAGDFSNRDIGVRREKFERIHQITNDPIEEARSRESTEDPRFADILANDRKQWIKRNHAVEDTYEALCHGTLTAIVLGSDGRFFRLEAVDWRGAAFWQQIIRGGFIRSSAGESIGRHEGKRVLIVEAELSDWRAARKLSKPAPAAKKLVPTGWNLKCAPVRKSPVERLAIAARPLKISAFRAGNLTRFGNRPLQKLVHHGIAQVDLKIGAVKSCANCLLLSSGVGCASGSSPREWSRPSVRPAR